MKLTATTYLERINEIEDMVNEGKLPAQMGILAASLSNHRPDPNPEPDSEKLSSADIRDRLALVCDLSLNEVAEVMTALGYRVYVDPISGAEWAVRENAG